LLSTVFGEYESIRIPRTTELVKGARKHGEARTVDGVEVCLARNETVRRLWANDEKVLDGTEYLVSGPFKGESEI
jgi:salicylate hydroxylase